jgi:MerR family transcriptional regulator, copper efflux regulator
MNIGQAAKTSDISAKMIRYYESIGLVPRVGRTNGGYRDYDQSDIRRLQFIRRARDLGFSFESVRQLLKLWSDRRRSSSVVKTLALDHIAELETRAAELRQMIKTLRHLADACDGGDHPNCPIIEELETGSAASGATRRKVSSTRRGGAGSRRLVHSRAVATATERPGTPPPLHSVRSPLVK